MEAKELRLGNIIRHVGTGDNKTVTPNTILDCWEYPHKYAPIPLSAEILEKSGFDFERLGYNDFDIYGYYFIDNFVITKFNDKSFSTKLLDGEYTAVYFVHELQNIYSACKKTELNITL